METWVIQNKTTGEYWKSRSGKNSWKTKAAAKNAWANTYAYNPLWKWGDEGVRKKCDRIGVEPVPHKLPCEDRTIQFPYFDEQDTFVLVNLMDETPESSAGKLQKENEYLRGLLDRMHQSVFAPPRDIPPRTAVEKEACLGAIISILLKYEREKNQ